MSTIQTFIPAFTGYNTTFITNITTPKKTDFKDSILSIKAKAYMHYLSNHIENTWTKIKQGELLQEKPLFMFSDQKGKIITFTPIYGSDTPRILMEIDDGKFCERFFFNRKNPDDFRYEKIRETEYGFATLKTYNSITDVNTNIENLAESTILTYIPQIIPGHYAKEINEMLHNTKIKVTE